MLDKIDPPRSATSPAGTLSDYVAVEGLSVARVLYAFINDEALPGTGISAARFWTGLAAIIADLAPRNRLLLEKRDRLQAKIDAWHRATPRDGQQPEAYRRFLEAIGYTVPSGPAFLVSPWSVDPEIASTAGPQLVVPVDNARFAINAANARWGSLYDALYGTDAIAGQISPDTNYDADRGRKVVAYARDLLDRIAPLQSGSHASAVGYRISGRKLEVVKQDGSVTSVDDGRFIGYGGQAEAPARLLFRHHGLHVEVQIDCAHPIGASDSAGISDILLESAVTTIIDFEDSVAAVDAEDKVACYRNWLGLMRGDLEACLEKQGKSHVRRLASDRHYKTIDGEELRLPGRSLLLVRNVGDHLSTDAVLDAEGTIVPEAILDCVITAMIALHDLKGSGRFRNSRTGSVYIVKPKVHGPEEAAYVGDLFARVEDLLGLLDHTLKIGLMDEERRTSVNLAECIRQLRHRICFINTGFLDRTGDEIHTSMHAGPMIAKPEMKTSPWLAAYEAQNVTIGVAAGLPGHAQIGKGMWPAPDRMADMLRDKIAHPRAGATTAWVPSPTAATLHAIHYHLVDVAERQRAIEPHLQDDKADLLTIPVRTPLSLTRQEIDRELSNNLQGIIGYVVRWVEHGIGCSKVPDIDDVGLMEDRATLRISSQQVANWLLHGVVSEQEVSGAMLKMAAVVDRQNENLEGYRPMLADPEASFAYRAARELVFDAARQPNGYTEHILNKWRRKAKEAHRLAVAR